MKTIFSTILIFITVSISYSQNIFPLHIKFEIISKDNNEFLKIQIKNHSKKTVQVSNFALNPLSTDASESISVKIITSCGNIIKDKESTQSFSSSFPPQPLLCRDEEILKIKNKLKDRGNFIEITPEMTIEKEIPILKILSQFVSNRQKLNEIIFSASIKGLILNCEGATDLENISYYRSRIFSPNFIYKNGIWRLLGKSKEVSKKNELNVNE